MSLYLYNLKKEIKFWQWSIKTNNSEIKRIEKEMLESNTSASFMAHYHQLQGRYNAKPYLEQRLQDEYRKIH